MNSENNNDMGAISLGSVDNSNNLNSMPVPPMSVDNSVGPVPPVDNNIPTPIGENNSVNLSTTSDILPTSPIENAVPTPEVTPVESIPTPEPVSPVAPVEPVAPVAPTPAPSIDSGYSAIPNNNIGTVPPINNNGFEAPVAPVATMPSAPQSEEAPAPTTPVAPVAPVEPLPYDIPETINNISSVPVFNDIGTIPPIPDTPAAVVNHANPSKKKGMNKIVFVIIVLLAMAAVGAGVYIFLHLSNQNSSGVKVKNVEIEIGSNKSSLITDYATFNGIDYNVCSLDTTEIKETNTLNAEYPFAITCSGTVYKGTAKIVDKTKPEVTLKGVKAEINAEVKPEDFIDSCKDSTKCSYAFKDETKLKDDLTKSGSYEVPIIVKDEAGNEVEVTGSLTVNANVADLYLICTKGNENLTETNKLGIVNNEFNKANTRSYSFKLSSEEYQSLKTESSGKTEVTYKNITGTAEFRDEDTTLIISKYLTYEELNKEANQELPLQIGALKEFYVSKEYTCNLGY